MTRRSSSLLLWTPRVLGILVCLFLSIFALDAFGGGKTFLQGMRDFLLHMLPMLLLLAVVGASWRWPWLGGVVFTAVAILYSWWAAVVRHHPDWILFIGGPLLAVGILFLLSWRQRRRTLIAGESVRE